MSQEEPKNTGMTGWKIRAGLHILFGILYLAIAALVLVYRKFIVELEPVIAYAVGGLLLLYGLFRIWRGIAQWQAGPDRP